MRVFMRFYFVLFLSLSLTACSLPRGAALMQEVVRETKADSPSFQVIEVTRTELATVAQWPRAAKQTKTYWPKASKGPNSSTIRAGDTVDLIIWDSNDNSLITSPGQKSTEMRGLTVSPSGAIFVPYLDDVVISGMTANDARRNIQTRLTDISPSAQVQLMLRQGLQNSVDLVSGVTSPGTYPLPSRNYNILSLLSQGGGIDKTLRNPQVRLVRGSKTYSIRAEALLSDHARNITLQGGDTVIVREDDRYFTALGATGSERIVYFDKEEITAMEALSMLGGLSDGRANLKAVLVLREYSTKQVGTGRNSPDLPYVVFAFDLTNADGLFAARNFDIEPDDTVLATESAVNAARALFGLIGSAFGLANAASGN
ncbi:polysaccharide biosynthesis/export family protein [Lentibacter sp.]|uniref:polysaccharide biosynthesis/export family protein n=1 Tax=Lentibacter sp. TaxID=2024994 RepID=UPI003F6990D0